MTRRHLVLVFPLLAAACGRDGDPVLARVDSRPITLEDFNREMDGIPPSSSEYLQTPAGRKELLDLMIRRNLVTAEAGKSPIADRPEIRKKLAELDAEFLRQRQEARERLLVGEFIRDLRESQLKVSDEDVKAAWSKESEAKASHILVSDEKTAQALRARLEKGESFEALAKENSQDPTGKKGGDLGYIMPGTLDPAFEAALFPLETGKIGGPVASPYGFHLIKKTGQRALSERPLAELERPIRAMLENRRFQAWLSDAKKRHAITINEAALDKAGPPISTSTPQ